MWSRPGDAKADRHGDPCNHKLGDPLRHDLPHQRPNPAPAIASTIPNTPPIVSPRIERMANCLYFSDRRSTAIGTADSVDNTGKGASAQMRFLISTSCIATAINGRQRRHRQPEYERHQTVG